MNKKKLLLTIIVIGYYISLIFIIPFTIETLWNILPVRAFYMINIFIIMLIFLPIPIAGAIVFFKDVISAWKKWVNE